MQLTALSEAINWYDVAVPYVLSQNTNLAQSAEMQKSYNRANGARNLGINPGATEQEQELSLRTAVRLYEKIVRESKVIPKMPEMETYYKKLEAVRGKLEASQARLTGKFDTVVTPLNKAFGGKIKFAVAEAEKARQFDGNGTVTFSREYAQQLYHQVKREGVLPLLLSQLRTVLTASAVQVVDGQHVVKLDQVLPSVQTVADAWLAYLGTVPSRLLIRNIAARTAGGPGVVVGNGKQPKKPKAPKVPGVASGPKSNLKRTKGEKIGGMYAPGSAMAMIWARLQDGQWHKQADVTNGLPCADPAQRLIAYSKDLRHNFWRVEFNKDEVRAVFTKTP